MRKMLWKIYLPYFTISTIMECTESFHFEAVPCNVHYSIQMKTNIEDIIHHQGI